MKNFEQRLKGGHPNSLGNTVEIVEEVLTEPQLFDELFNCYFSDDEVVRLRVSNAIKRISKANKLIVLPYIDLFLNEISKIDQASTQWTLSQLFLQWEMDMTQKQLAEALDIMKHNLENHHDWIVLNQTMTTLGEWAKQHTDLKEWLKPHLLRLSNDQRKSVASRATKILGLLT